MWTYHVNLRMAGRFIPRTVVLAAVDSYELVEANPEDKYLPSYLILAECGGERFHVLFAADVATDHVRIVTTYRPDVERWEPDLKRRRTSP